jgi:hypothetical protein
LRLLFSLIPYLKITKIIEKAANKYKNAFPKLKLLALLQVEHFFLLMREHKSQMTWLHFLHLPAVGRSG